MEIKLNGKGKDEKRTLILEEHIPTEEEKGEGQIFIEDKVIVTIGKESVQVSGDELRRASIALCPIIANMEVM